MHSPYTAPVFYNLNDLIYIDTIILCTRDWKRLSHPVKTITPRHCLFSMYSLIVDLAADFQLRLATSGLFSVKRNVLERCKYLLGECCLSALCFGCMFDYLAVFFCQDCCSICLRVSKKLVTVEACSLFCVAFVRLAVRCC